MGKVAYMWNPRGNQKLRRYWVAFGDQIVIGGENHEQSGVLSLRPARPGELRARLRVLGHEYEETVRTGKDIAVWINGLTLCVGMKAVDDGRVLVAFGITPGATVNVTLDAASDADDQSVTPAMATHCAGRARGIRPIGLCQTSS